MEYFYLRIKKAYREKNEYCYTSVQIHLHPHLECTFDHHILNRL